MKPEGSLPHLRVTANCPYPESDLSSSYQPIPLPANRSIYYSPICIWASKMVAFPQISSPKPCVHLSTPNICATRPAHLIFLDLINRLIFGEYRSLSSSTCSLLHPSVTSSLLGLNILLSAYYQIPAAYVSPLM